MEQVLTHKEFKELSEDLQKLHLQAWRTRYSNKDIAKGMGVSLSLVSKFIVDLGLSGERKPRIKSVKETKEKPKQKAPVKTEAPTVEIGTPVPAVAWELASAPLEEVQAVEVEPQVAVQEEAPVKPTLEFMTKKPTFTMNLDNTLSGSRLAVQLRAIADFVEDEENCVVDMTITCQ